MLKLGVTELTFGDWQLGMVVANPGTGDAFDFASMDRIECCQGEVFNALHQ